MRGAAVAACMLAVFLAGCGTRRVVEVRRRQVDVRMTGAGKILFHDKSMSVPEFAKELKRHDIPPATMVRVICQAQIDPGLMKEAFRVLGTAGYLKVAFEGPSKALAGPGARVNSTSP